MTWSHLTETTMLQWRFRVPGTCYDWTPRCWPCQSYGPMQREYNWNHPQKRLTSHCDYIDLQIRNTKMSNERNIMQCSLPLKMKQTVPLFGPKWMTMTLQGKMEHNFRVLIWFRFVKFLLVCQTVFSHFSMDQAAFETAYLLICNTGFGARLRQVLGVADTGFFGGWVSKMQSQSFGSGNRREFWISSDSKITEKGTFV